MLLFSKRTPKYLLAPPALALNTLIFCLKARKFVKKRRNLVFLRTKHDDYVDIGTRAAGKFHVCTDKILPYATVLEIVCVHPSKILAYTSPPLKIILAAPMVNGFMTD